MTINALYLTPGELVDTLRTWYSMDPFAVIAAVLVPFVILFVANELRKGLMQ